jgi:hypothetical protein
MAAGERMTPAACHAFWRHRGRRCGRSADGMASAACHAFLRPRGTALRRLGGTDGRRCGRSADGMASAACHAYWRLRDGVAVIGRRMTPRRPSRLMAASRTALRRSADGDDAPPPVTPSGGLEDGVAAAGRNGWTALRPIGRRDGVRRLSRLLGGLEALPHTIAPPNPPKVVRRARWAALASTGHGSHPPNPPKAIRRAR